MYEESTADRQGSRRNISSYRCSRRKSLTPSTATTSRSGSCAQRLRLHTKRVSPPRKERSDETADTAKGGLYTTTPVPDREVIQFC